VQILGRWGRRPQSIYGPLDTKMMWLQLRRWKLSHEETLLHYFRQKLKFIGKIAKLRFVPPFWRLRGNVHGSSMARWKAHGRLPISAN